MKAGDCPKCGSHYLEYGKMKKVFRLFVGYPYRCEDCGFEGCEVYEVKFIEHRDEEGNPCTE